MSGPVNAKTFVCLCAWRCSAVTLCFLCVPYLAGINRGGRLERVEGV